MCRQNTIVIAITDPSPCDRGMNAEQAWICRYSRSVYTRFGKVGPSSRNGAGRAESNNRTRFVCKPPPNGQQEHTNHCPPPSMENSRVQSRVPATTSPWTPWTVERDTAISANDSSNVHRIQISTVLFRAFGQKVQTSTNTASQSGIRRKGYIWIYICIDVG